MMYMQSLSIQNQTAMTQLKGNDGVELGLFRSAPRFNVTIVGTFEDYMKDIIYGGGTSFSTSAMTKFYQNGIYVNGFGTLIPLNQYNINLEGIGPYSKVSVSFEATLPEFATRNVKVPNGISVNELNELYNWDTIRNLLSPLDGYVENWAIKMFVDTKVIFDLSHMPTSTPLYVKTILYGYSAHVKGYATYLSYIQAIQHGALKYNDDSLDMMPRAFILSSNAQWIGEQWVSYTLDLFITKSPSKSHTITFEVGTLDDNEQDDDGYSGGGYDGGGGGWA